MPYWVFNEITKLDLCAVVTREQNEECGTDIPVYCFVSCSLPPPGETHQQMCWQHVLCFWKFIACNVCLYFLKKVFRSDKCEHSSSTGPYAFFLVSLMCLSGAVLEQNFKSIKQLVHPSPWLSPGKIYWLRQEPGHTRTSSFLRSWLDTESCTGPWVWYNHRVQACNQGLIPLYIYHSGWPFPVSLLVALQHWKLCCGITLYQ